MAVWRVTFFFESNQQALLGVGSSLGWTESWYKNFNQNTGVEAVLTDPDIEEYIFRRTTILDSIYRINFVRVSNTEHPRVFKIATVGVGMGTGKFVSVKASQVQCALLADMTLIQGAPPNQRTHHRRLMVRGLPSQFINGNVLDPLAAGWGNMVNFLNFIGNKPAGGVHPALVPNFSWGIRYESSGAAGLPITRLKMDPASNKTVLWMTPNSGQIVGGKVLISGAPAPNQDANRFWTMRGTTVDTGVTYDVLTGNRKPIDVDYTGPGRAVYKKPDYNALPVTQYAIIGLRNRKTGRAFRQLRGRR